MYTKVWILLLTAIMFAACSKGGSDQMATSAPSKYSLAQVASGRSLHARILDKHPSVDQFYRKASLWGAMTATPLAVVSVPTADWQVLSKEEREALGAYAASCVAAIRASPFDYTNIPASAPVVPTIRANAAAMTENSWGIMVGAISQDGRDIMSDDFAVKGQ